MEAKQKWSSSHAWRGILQGNKLLRHGLKWNVGNGKQIHVWRDCWIPVSLPRPASGHGAMIFPNLKVSDLFLPGITLWGTEKIGNLISPHDIPLLNQIRPSIRLLGSIQRVARSGYHLLRSLTSSSNNFVDPSSGLYQKICTEIFLQKSSIFGGYNST